MKKVLLILAIAIAASAAARAQVAPAANAGPASFGWSLNYAQSAEFGNGLGDSQTSNANGSIHYSSGLERAPFSVAYAGGYGWTLAGPEYSTGFFQHLLGSQSLLWRRVRVGITDDVSFLPQAPITGFAGVAGTGQPVQPNPAPGSDQNILTVNTRSVDNFLGASVMDRISLATSITGSGGWGILSYPDGNGIDVNSYEGTAGLSQRINSRMSVIGSFAYSQFGYPGYDLNFHSYSTFGGFNRVWSRRFSTNVSGGPQWVGSSDSTLIPSSTNFGINADASYALRYLALSVIYTRGVSGGSGYLLGAHTDVISSSLSRGFGRNPLSVGVMGSYRRVVSLNGGGAIDSEDIGVQASRRFGAHLNTFAAYTVINQGTNGALPGNVLGTALQSFSFGFGFLPRESRIIR
jgi:hypothetical protein